ASLPVIDNAWTVTVDGDGDGRPDASGLSPVPAADPALVRLLPNVPNPFNPVTSIHFEVSGSEAVDVELTIYDLRGRLVTTLVRGPMAPGAHKAVWDGRAADGRPVSAGTYFSRLQSRGMAWTRPLSLVK
ncbi:MAG: FlgD immunoglobulin-like domain containing protein, partial [bacterium]